MKLLLWILSVTVGVVGALVFVLWVIGRNLAQEHVAEGSIEVEAVADSVAARIRDVERQVSWRNGISGITIESRQNAGVLYRELRGSESVAYTLYEREPNRTFESVISDKTLPYGGRWLIYLEGKSDRLTKVTIREEGIVYSPMYRVLGRYVFGFDTTLKAYLSDLAKSFSSRN